LPKKWQICKGFLGKFSEILGDFPQKLPPFLRGFLQKTASFYGKTGQNVKPFLGVLALQQLFYGDFL
jgi:hypothetical protein